MDGAQCQARRFRSGRLPGVRVHAEVGVLSFVRVGVVGLVQGTCAELKGCCNEW